MPFALLTGGARSGKSALAERLAVRSGRPVVFIATGEAGDDEMSARISAHRAARPSEWATVEAPLDLAAAVGTAAADAFLVIDCLTLWVSNLMHAGRSGESETEVVIEALGGRSGDAVVVTNEVGLGIVPDNALAREYRDTLGRVNIRFSAAASEVRLVVAGRSLILGESHDA